MADELITVRIPALTEQTGLSLNDRIPVWVNSTDKTRQTTVGQLRTFILEGFSGSQPPVYTGGSYIVTVPAELDGEQTFPIASLAGKTFILRRSVAGPMALNSYEILDAGGFKLTLPEDTLHAGETFELENFEFQSNPGGAGGSMSLSGVKLVSLNTALLAADMGKLIQIRAQNNSITLGLPDIATVPENSILVIETMINNTKQHAVSPVGGQRIYFNNTSYGGLRMGVSELLHLFAGSDGWYVINYHGHFTTVGEITPKYRAGLNQILLNGASLNRADYPRLWEWAQTLGSSLVSESTWQTASVSMSNPTRSVVKPYRGCFSTGNGSTTFRIPDLQGMALRGLRAGSDTERLNNIPGNYQDDMYKSHQHDQPGDGIGGGDRQSLQPSPNADEGFNGSNLTAASGGAETRMENIGVNWYMNY